MKPVVQSCPDPTLINPKFFRFANPLNVPLSAKTHLFIFSNLHTLFNFKNEVSSAFSLGCALFAKNTPGVGVPGFPLTINPLESVLRPATQKPPRLCYIFNPMADLLPNPTTPSREDAWKLLCEYTQSESLRKHMLAVEACVRAYARQHAQDQELWGLTALLHDFDYERWPNNAHAPDAEHPAAGAKILRERGYPEELVRAILSHAEYCHVPRQTALEHTLFACDELAGFLVACTYVRPSKSILDLEPDSVKKRLKDKAFARGVNREDVRKGAEELGVPLDEHIAFCIAALRENADALGIRGSL
jgi:putative nucleotidyltransferase with HDIG domain